MALPTQNNADLALDYFYHLLCLSFCLLLLLLLPSLRLILKADILNITESGPKLVC